MWWNPFRGGRPAGFFYPRMGATGAWAPRSPRVGIMTSPELAAENARLHKSGGAINWWKRGKHRSQDSGDYPPSTAGSGPPTADDQYPAIPASVLPGWGAGWGRIDRGSLGTKDDIRLQDVGSLLK